MPEHHELTLTIIPDGSRPEQVQDSVRTLRNDLNREKGLRADLPTRKNLEAKGLDPQLAKLLIDIVTDPKVIAAFLSLLGVFLRPRPEFVLEVRRKGKKLRITARDFNHDQIKQLDKGVRDFLEK